MPGVIRTRVGYAGGTTADPTYHNIGDHAEALQVDFDPSVVAYEDLLRLFWGSHRPTMRSSSQYRSAILAADAEQLAAARRSHAAAEAELGRSLYSQIEALDRFYLAEDYHQKYRLQRFLRAAQELRAIYPRLTDFVDSTAATRINALAGGHLALADRDRELDSYGLSERARRELRASRG